MSGSCQWFAARFDPLLGELSRIADGIRRKDPSGVTHAHVLAAAGWGNALRESGACT